MAMLNNQKLYNNGEYIYIYVLVGGWPTPLKNMKVSWDDENPHIWKNKTCSKPPTRYAYIYMENHHF